MQYIGRSIQPISGEPESVLLFRSPLATFIWILKAKPFSWLIVWTGCGTHDCHSTTIFWRSILLDIRFYFFLHWVLTTMWVPILWKRLYRPNTDTWDFSIPHHISDSYYYYNHIVLERYRSNLQVDWQVHEDKGTEVCVWNLLPSSNPTVNCSTSGMLIML